jgi:pimeloyl-ACP methyl ester carboxylesterase
MTALVMTQRSARGRARLRAAIVVMSLSIVTAASAQTRATISIRGHDQTLYLYGPATGDPVVVSSGDGGWMHLGPHVAELLARRGMFVVGVDVRAYLSSFTSGRTALRAEDEPRDYRILAQFASKPSGRPPILIGVSEGAGLSVLAATDPETKTEIAGVIGLGLPDMNELAWRWKDSLIYLTHKAANEPAFSAAAVIDRVAPAPLAIIHSTHDEFVPLTDVQRMFKAGREPKRLWVVEASNHRFSDNLDEFDRRLVEAIAWVRDRTPR